MNPIDLQSPQDDQALMTLEDSYMRLVDQGYMTMSVTPDGDIEFAWTDYGVAMHDVAAAAMRACGTCALPYRELKLSRWKRIKQRVPTVVSSTAVLLSVQALVRAEWHVGIVQTLFRIH